MNDKEILKIAQEAYEDFVKDYLVECKFRMVSLTDFFKIAKKSEIVKGLIQDGFIKSINTMSIPALIVHEPSRERVYLCKAIINRLVKKLSKEKQKLFVRAIVLHELYHILFEDYVRKYDIYNFIKSEKRANDEFKADYPDLEKVLKEVKKKAKI